MILVALVLVFKSTLILESSEFAFSYNILFIFLLLKCILCSLNSFLPFSVNNLEYGCLIEWLYCKLNTVAYCFLISF